MPKPLFMKLIVQAAIGFFCVLIGCVYSISSNDYIFLLMSLLIGICSLVRFVCLYQMIRCHRYFTLEGQCKNREPSLFKKTQQILLLAEGDREYRFTLDKNVKILRGHYYRLYFRIPEAPSKASSKESAELLQSFHFLGFEEMSSVSNATSEDM